MLCKPAFIAGKYRRDTQRKALFTEQRVSTVTRTVRPNRAFFGELRNVFVLHVGAGPNAVVLFAVVERFSDRMHTRDPCAVRADIVEHFRADSRHDVHIAHDVCAVGDFDAVFADRRTDRSHAERNDVHRAAVHTALVQRFHRLFEFFGIYPVIRRACIIFFFRCDKGTRFDARNVGRE